MRLREKIAIVTGAGTGIGKEISRLFCREGARVVLAGLPDTPLATVADELTEEGGSAIPIACDVTMPEVSEKVVNTAIAQFGGLDILVNNAAISIARRIEDLSYEEWNRVLHANLTGQFLMAQAAISEMRQRHDGTIINIGSIHDRVSEPQSVAYASSKGGVAQLTRSLAIEVGPENILVNSISPGFIGGTKLAIANGVDETTTDRFQKNYIDSGRIPLKRAGCPTDIAAAVLFLPLVNVNT